MVETGVQRDDIVVVELIGHHVSVGIGQRGCQHAVDLAERNIVCRSEDVIGIDRSVVRGFCPT